MRLLITGSKGQLGNELIRCLETMEAEIGPISEAYHGAIYDAIDYDVLDISNSEAVNEWFCTHEYDIVINCAAITNVDGCELDEEGAYLVNALGPQNIAQACASQNAKLIQVSTDYVFPGNEPGNRKESDKPNPISAYGRTKLAGEQFTIANNSRSFICRTAWLYGYIGNNFVKTMRQLGASRKSVTVVDDQIGNPTSANDLAYELLKIALTENYGVYHITNNGTCSWADFADAIMRGSGLDCRVIPITSEQYKQQNPASANRPHYSSLENSKLASTIGDEMRPWQEALKSYLELLPKLKG